MSKVLSVLLMIVAAVAFTSCGKKAAEKAQERALEKAIEKQSGGKVKADLSKGQFTIKDKSGETSVAGEGGAQINPDFPKDILIYKGASAIASFKQGQSFTLMLKTTDDMKTVADAYKASMKAQGWKEESDMSMGDVTSLGYSKEKRKAVVSVSKDNKATQISIVTETE